MHRSLLSDTTLALAVRATVARADVTDALAAGAQRRLARLRDDGEAGAQAAEYAMLGGVSAAACGALVALFRNEDVLQRVVDAVITALTRVIRAWF